MLLSNVRIICSLQLVLRVEKTDGLQADHGDEENA